MFRGMGREPDRASAWGAKHSSFVLFCPLELLDVVLDRNASIETNSWAQALREIVISGTKARMSIQHRASRCINRSIQIQQNSFLVVGCRCRLK